MKVIYGLGNSKKKIKNAYLTIGIFDGLHLGHKFIIQKTIKKAKLFGGKSVVLTFWPHPEKEPLIHSLRHRINLIKNLKPDFCIIINFTKKFSKTTPEDFIKNILKKIEIKEIFIGPSFTFGKNALGDINLLKKLAKKFNFKADIIKPLKINQEFISSTLIRRLIQKGDINLARRYLGRSVSVMGRVVRGEKRGRLLGYPTANVKSEHEVLSATGIYVAKIILDKNKLNGICYIGTKPTFKKYRKQKIEIEAHIFNFKKNIYNKFIEIQFLKKIRNDKKFPDKTSLLEQIRIDEKKAKNLLEIH